MSLQGNQMSWVQMMDSRQGKGGSSIRIPSDSLVAAFKTCRVDRRERGQELQIPPKDDLE